MKVLVALAYVLAVAVGGGGAVWFGWAAAHARREDQALVLMSCGLTLVAVVMAMTTLAAGTAARAETLNQFRKPRS